MKLDVLLPGTGVPTAAPYPTASPERFGQVAGAVAQLGSNLEAGGILALDEVQRRKLEAARLDAHLKRIEEDNAAQKLMSDAEKGAATRIDNLKANPDPLNHQAGVETELAAVRDLALSTEKRPGVIQRFNKAWEQFARTQAIHAIADQRGMKVGQAQADTLKIVKDLEDAAGGTTDPAAFKVLQDQIGARFLADSKAGVFSPKEAFTLATKSVDQAYINRAMGDARRNPAAYLMKDLTGTNPYADKIHGEQLTKIQDFALKRLEAMERKVGGAFTAASGDLLKELTVASRAGDIGQAIIDQRGSLTVEHFERALSINDAQQKSRNVGVTDQRVLTTVRDLVDTRKINTPEQLTPYAGMLSEPDYRLQLDKVSALAESDRKEFKSDAHRIQDRAIKTGEQYIRDSTQVTAALIAFDSTAKFVQAEQTNRFLTEAANLTEAGDINALARKYVGEARLSLAEKLRIDGTKANPLLDKYKTEPEIKAAQARGEFDRTTSDNMINLVRYIDGLTGAAEQKAAKALGEQAGAAATKAAKPTLGGALKDVVTGQGTGRLLDLFRGKQPLTRPDVIEMAPLAKKAAQELFPNERMIDLMRDEVKADAISRRVIEKLQQGAK